MILCVAVVVRVTPHSICGLTMRVRHEGERDRILIGALAADGLPIDGLAVQARRRTGLQAAKRRPKRCKRGR